MRVKITEDFSACKFQLEKMQNILKLSLILLFFALGGLAFSTNNKTDFHAENPAVEDTAVAPRDLYIRNCARCHGADGTSQTELGKTLEAPDLTSKAVQKMSVKKIARVITKGDGAMPAFGKKLSKAEIASLANYVRSF